MTPQEACNFPLDLENHYGYVYCVTFPSNKKYIGQSKRPWKYRWKCHHSNTSLCPAMRNALQKYSIEELTWELLEYADTPQELTDKETYYIQTLSTLSPNGYNVTLPCKAYPYPEEKKNRIRLGLALHHLHKTNPAATLEDAKQYILDQDYKAAHRVKKGTPEWIEQCKRVAKQREAVLREKGFSRKVTNSKGHPDSLIHETRAVAVYETGEKFNSITEFCEKYKIPNSSVCYCLQKKNKCVHGLHIYPADISETELSSYLSFWETPLKQQTGVLTCIETRKQYKTAREAAEEQGVTRARIHAAARFPTRTINGLHFSYIQDKSTYHDGKRSIYCAETRKIYSSLRDAARELFHITDTEQAHRTVEQISKVAKGLLDSYNGLHFSFVDNDTVYKEDSKYNTTSNKDRKNLPVKCITTGVTYSTAKEASEKLNIPLSQIFFLASLPKRSYKGYHFTYAPASPSTEAPTSNSDISLQKELL